jgi:hypothetical protein
VKKINPNSFITIDAEWLDKDDTNKWIKTTHTRPWKDIKELEKTKGTDGKIYYWVYVGAEWGNKKVLQFKITEALYNSLANQIKMVDWDIPITEDIEMVREMVKEEVGKSRVIRSAIMQLDVSTE